MFEWLEQDREGSFALNPPYVHDYYVELSKLLKQRLASAEEAGVPLSFMVVVGANDAVRQSEWYIEHTITVHNGPS